MEFTPSPIQTFTVGPGIPPGQWTLSTRGLSPPVGTFTPPRRLYRFIYYVKTVTCQAGKDAGHVVARGSEGS